MSPVVPLLAVLLLASPGKGARPPESRLEQGQRLFTSGEVEASLRVLDAAAAEGGDDATLERVHLLRARCFAARQDFGHAEEAFALALESNPEAALDPTRVDPTVVKLLDATRARLQGTVAVASHPAGAEVTVDGQPAGAAPLSLPLGVGRHRLEVRWPEGGLAAAEVQVRPRRELRVEYVRAGPAGLAGRRLGPIADFRFAPEFSLTPMVYPVFPLELAVGLEVSHFRVTVAVRVAPGLALTPRLAFALPVLERLGVVLELGMPALLEPVDADPLKALGIAAGVGVEYLPLSWLGAFAMVGARYYLKRPANDAAALTATAGLRLRLP
jgi:hypothetical protein